MVVTRKIAITTAWVKLSTKLTAALIEGVTLTSLKGPGYLRNPAGSGETLRIAAGYAAAPPGGSDGVAVGAGETFPIDAFVKFNADKIWVKGTDPFDAEFVIGSVGTQVIVAPA